MGRQIKITLPGTKEFSALIIIAASITILLACRKTNFNSTSLTTNFLNAATVSVAGRVTDLNNLPISNASVTAGTSVTTTDIDGQFIIKNAQLSKDGGFVKVSKAGYFPGSRTFLINANGVVNVKIKLIPKMVSGNFAAFSGGIVNVWGGGSVTFSAGTIVSAETGDLYTGNVSVSTFFLDPVDARSTEYMPGDLRGINTSNQERILQSFGMVSIEMNAPGGEKLQLAAGKTATITFPIPPSLQAKAPATIPLWYFDETKGIWKEEGNATRQGNDYVGKVAHFSFWNCDLPAEYVRLDIIFKDQKGNALTNKLVTVSSASYGIRSGYTDSNGGVSGLIPANETLIIKVFDQCGEILYTKNIGPFSIDANLGSTTVDFVRDQYSVTLSGTVINCSNTVVTNGYVQLRSGNNYFNAAITKGYFNVTFDRCTNLSTPVTLIAYDEENLRQSAVQTLVVTVGGNQNIGQLKACEDYTYY